MKKILFLILFLTGISPVFNNNALYLGCNQVYGQEDYSGVEVVFCTGTVSTIDYENDFYIDYNVCSKEYSYEQKECVASNDCHIETETKTVDDGGGDDDDDDDNNCGNATCSPGFVLNSSCECVEENPCSITCPEGQRVTPNCGCEEIPPPCNITYCSTGYNLINCECVKINTQPPPDPDSCVKDSNNKIKQITETKFSGIINMFNNVNSPFKVNVFTGSLGGDPNLAHTELSGIPRTYNIILNKDFPNATSLSLNASILHEYVHAFFNTLYDDWKNNGNTHAYDKYPVLKSFYIDGTYWGNSQDAQHEQIADSFINNIANSLKELQPGLSDQYYQDMAWGTLQGTAAYNSDKYLNQTERDRIGKERSSEKNNQQVGDNTPKGIPCNK